MTSGKFTSGHRRSAKLTSEQVFELRQLYAEGWSQGALSRQFGISVGQIGRIVRGESWQDYQQVPTDHEQLAAMRGFQPTEEEINESIELLKRKLAQPDEPQIDVLEQILKRGGDNPLRQLGQTADQPQETRNEDSRLDQHSEDEPVATPSQGGEGDPTL